MTTVLSLGRERRVRERTLEVASIAAGEAVLDVGCGTGTLALAAKRQVGDDGSVEGIDPSPEMIGRAREKAARHGLEIVFEVAGAEELPFSDERFDAVLCTLVFHHISEESRGKAIDEMRRVVNPGGRLLIVEPEKPRGISALLHPGAILRAHHAGPALGRALDLMKRAGFAAVVTGPLGFGGLGYVLGRRD
jgi:demethylmenaquinone methyltransferase/2-methoxy-6-polyprenyl-1,4-benzoquinol methylase/phosphoethanolamine N-methyltransferase